MKPLSVFTAKAQRTPSEHRSAATPRLFADPAGHTDPALDDVRREFLGRTRKAGLFHPLSGAADQFAGQGQAGSAVGLSLAGNRLCRHRRRHVAGAAAPNVLQSPGVDLCLDVPVRLPLQLLHRARGCQHAVRPVRRGNAGDHHRHRRAAGQCRRHRHAGPARTTGLVAGSAAQPLDLGNDHRAEPESCRLRTARAGAGFSWSLGRSVHCAGPAGRWCGATDGRSRWRQRPGGLADRRETAAPAAGCGVRRAAAGTERPLLPGRRPVRGPADRVFRLYPGRAHGR